MLNSWEQADIFPAIARIITDTSQAHCDFVTHDAIVAALLTDSEAAPIIANARDQSPEPHTSDWIAHNMVAWFSQRITVRESDFAQQFERKKINGKWAYRPKTSGRCIGSASGSDYIGFRRSAEQRTPPMLPYVVGEAAVTPP
jgi:hypothetical protein